LHLALHVDRSVACVDAQRGCAQDMVAMTPSSGVSWGLNTIQRNGPLRACSMHTHVHIIGQPTVKNCLTNIHQLIPCLVDVSDGLTRTTYWSVYSASGFGDSLSQLEVYVVIQRSHAVEFVDAQFKRYTQIQSGNLSISRRLSVVLRHDRTVS